LRIDKPLSERNLPVVITPDMRILTLAGADNRLTVLGIPDGRVVSELDMVHRDTVFALSPDATKLATMSHSEGTITIRTFPSLDPSHTISRRAAIPGQFAISSDARVMASTCSDGFIRVRALADDREIYSDQVGDVNDIPALNRLCLALSSDGHTLAIGNANHERGLVDVNTFARRPLPIDSHVVLWMMFSPDDRLLAVASADLAVRVIDRATGKLAHILRHSGHVCALAFSADSLTLATAVVNGPVILWHVATGLQMAVLEELPGDVRALRFAPDGRSLAAFVELPNRAGGELYVLSAAADQPEDR
jgi:WD40 repeat protein